MHLFLCVYDDVCVYAYIFVCICERCMCVDVYVCITIDKK